MNASTPFSELIPALLQAKQRTDAAMKAMKATATEVAESELAQKAVALYKAHSPNFRTYALIVAVVALMAVKTATEFALTHYSRREEYRLIAQIKLIKIQRFFIRIAIAAEKARFTYGPRFMAAMDKIFCLG